jgi:2-iminobutanoate/2-iminopropanoate deaminase
MAPGGASPKDARRESVFRNCTQSFSLADIRAYPCRASARRQKMVEINSFCAPGVFDPPSYSQATRVTGGSTMLFLSGQVAYDANGGVAHPGDFGAQAHEVLSCVKRLVEAAGGTMDNIVKLTTFLTDINHRAALIPIRNGFFSGKLPASTLVEVSALVHPDWLIEIEAIAVL